MKKGYFWFGSIGLPIIAIVLFSIFSSIYSLRYLSWVSLAFVFFFSIICIFKIIENEKTGKSVWISLLFVLSATIVSALAGLLVTLIFCKYSGRDMCGLTALFMPIYTLISFLLAGIIALILKSPLKLISEKLGKESLLIFVDALIIAAAVFLIIFSSAYAEQYQLRNSPSWNYRADIALHDALNLSTIIMGVAYLISLVLLFFCYFFMLKRENPLPNNIKNASMFIAIVLEIVSLIISYMVYLSQLPVSTSLIILVLAVIIVISLTIFFGKFRTGSAG